MRNITTEQPPSPILNKRQVAALLGKSLRTVDAYMRNGYLPVMKLGKSVLFNRDAVLAHLAKYQVGGGN